MKSTGIVRHVDSLGRFVLPIELRRLLDIDTDSRIEIFTDEDAIILRKYRPSCTFCGEVEGIAQYKNHSICPKCLAALAKMAKQ